MTRTEWRVASLIALAAGAVLMLIWLGVEAWNSTVLEPVMEGWVQRETEEWPLR